ncbi:MAG: hypothetical protein HFI36_06820 [Bacilli bacterium]|jgi:hypothetical protein|nr:hypothetical protein [Bacilli bacterium]MCX4254817.1 hypothetical protein [Bacilli bacterium]
MDFIRRGFKIDTLYLARLGKTRITDKDDGTLFVLERLVDDVTFNGETQHIENYTEAVVNAVISSRIIGSSYTLPEGIIEIYPFSKDLCTSEELESGLISDKRLYEITRNINRNRPLNVNQSR